MNIKIILSTMLVIAIMIGVPSVMKVTSAHEQNLQLVTEKRITEAAIKCIKEEVCSGTMISLKMLYEKEYLTEESDPITKEIYDETSYVSFNEEIVKFVKIN
ncbi:MAG: hypothetical protein R3Y13_00820 [bacterium]